MNMRKPNQPNPHAARPKAEATAPKPKLPPAPPVYRPQLAPRVAQPKAAIGRQATPARANPVAPPAYRPQPTPKVLQKKSPPGAQPHTRPSTSAPVARHASHAEPKRVVQPKTAAHTPLKPTAAPPIKRPQPTQGVPQAKKNGESVVQAKGPVGVVRQTPVGGGGSAPRPANRPPRVGAQGRGVIQPFLKDKDNVVWMGGSPQDYWTQNRTRIEPLLTEAGQPVPGNINDILKTLLDKNITEYTFEDVRLRVITSRGKLYIKGLQITRTSEGLAMSGTLPDGKPVKGSVYLPEYYIDATGKARIQPTRVAEAGSPERAFTKAMRVHNITAEPKGIRLGDFLAYHAASIAKNAGITHIVAMKVVPAARNFYVRLGFLEYDASRSYEVLVERKRKIQESMLKATGSEMAGLGEDLQATIAGMSEATLYVDVNTLMAKAATNWTSAWKKFGEGAYAQK